MSRINPYLIQQTDDVKTQRKSLLDRFEYLFRNYELVGGDPTPDDSIEHMRQRFLMSSAVQRSFNKNYFVNLAPKDNDVASAVKDVKDYLSGSQDFQKQNKLKDLGKLLDPTYLVSGVPKQFLELSDTTSKTNDETLLKNIICWCRYYLPKSILKIKKGSQFCRTAIRSILSDWDIYNADTTKPVDLIFANSTIHGNFVIENAQGLKQDSVLFLETTRELTFINLLPFIFLLGYQIKGGESGGRGLFTCFDKTVMLSVANELGILNRNYLFLVDRALAIDKSSNLVIIELKRDDSGSNVD